MKVLAAALFLLAGCGKPPEKPAEAPVAKPAGSATVVNETGEEVRDVWLFAPGGPEISKAPIHALKAGERATIKLPANVSRVSLTFKRKPDRLFEETATLLGDRVTFTLRQDGSVSADITP